MRRRAVWIFWGVLALCLLLGLGRTLDDPNHPQAGPGGLVDGGPVVISEFGATNGAGGAVDEDGDLADWIELYNQSSLPVDLEGWTLTDDPGQPDKWTFESITLAPGEYLLLFASGKDRDELAPEEGRPYLHTNFRLESDGGHLALYPPTSRHFLDATLYDYPAQFPDVSFGLAAQRGGWVQRYFGRPTPGAANDDQAVWAGILPPVVVSANRGFYSAPFTVTLSVPESLFETLAGGSTPQESAVSSQQSESVAIRYTTDGSTPTPDNGMDYAGPLTITRTTPLRAAAFLAGYRPAPVVTRSYLFVDDALAQPADPPGWPITWGTHHIDIGPYQANTPVQADYAMDSRIVDDPLYGPQLRSGLLALPSLSLVLDPAHLDIYADPQTRGPESERPVSVEWIDPSGQEPGFQINAGIRIQGGAGRWEYMPKHSFRLFFKQQYGAAKLNYPLFAGSQVTEFDTLVLRAGVDRGFAGYPSTPEAPVDLRQTTYTRDEWARASQIALSGVGSHGRFVHLYLNGLYWGLYNVVERPDASFAAGYLGGEKDEWATASHGGAVSGALDRFDVLLRLAAEGGLADPAKYATFLEFFDAVQFSDYLILNWYAGNRDWPENNWYVDVAYPAGRNLFFVWDAEATWDDGAAIRLGSDGWEGAPYPNVVKQIFTAAWENPDFQLLFADRLYKHLFGDGALSDRLAQARWQAIAGPLAQAIVAESARWGDVRYPDRPITQADWQAANDNVLAQMEGNGEKLLRLARAAALYPPIDPPQIMPSGRPSGHGATGSAFQTAIDVTLAAAAGDIYLTTDGSDPRLAVTGEIAPTAQLYTGPLHFTTTTTVKARVLAGSVWSALAETTFQRSGQRARLEFSEIMYHPYVDEEMEFLELKNLGDLDLDLAGAYFEGIDFRFPDGTRVRPGAHLVLVRDLKKFRQRYGDEVEVHGIYGGKLSDEGETLVLRAAGGTVLAQVTYDDDRGWPLSADGAGDSLVRRASVYDGDAVRGDWRASATLYGAPGMDEPGQR
jgi:hypothetical protein